MTESIKNIPLRFKVYAAFIVLIIFPFMIAILLSEPTPHASYKEDRSSQAFIACQNILRDQLASNAKFPTLDYSYKYYPESNQYNIHSWVEGQNAFGALLKKQYSCTVSYNQNTNVWFLANFHWLN